MLNRFHGRKGRMVRVSAVAAMGLAVAALGATAQASNSPSNAEENQRDNDVTITTAPNHIEAGPCRTNHVVITMANNSRQPVYVDLFIDTPEPIEVSRKMVSSYMPAGDRVTVPLRIDVPTDAAPGDYNVKFRTPGGHGSPETLPVEVGGPMQQECLRGEQLSASATSSQLPAHGPEKAVDDDLASIWHSQWQPNEPLPHTLMVTLEQASDVSELRYIPRTDSWSGIITEYTIYAGPSDGPLTEVASGRWAGDITEKVAVLNAPDTEQIKLVATQGNGGHASAAEIVVVGKN